MRRTSPTIRRLCRGVAPVMAAAFALAFTTGPAGIFPGVVPASLQTSISGLPRWAPPPQISPVVYTTTGNFQQISAGPQQDVTVYGNPKRVATGSLQITGGRNVRVIGGKWAKTTNGASIRVIGATKSIFIEGVDVDASGYNGDAINASGSLSGHTTYPDIYIENSRFTGLNGTMATTHADIYQPQGPVGHIYIDMLTGTSGYQGLYLPAEYPTGGATLSRINLVKLPNSKQPTTYLLWLGGVNQPAFPTILNDVYVKLPIGQSLSSAGVAPYRGQISQVAATRGAPVGVLVDGSGSAYWPSNVKATGTVSPGLPPQGDFVPAGSVGLGYGVHGYQ